MVDEIESEPKRHPDYKKWLAETKEWDIPYIVANAVQMGSDIDWFVESNWGFIFFEMKHFSKYRDFTVKYSQFQMFYRLYTKLKQTTSVEFYFIGYDDIDVKDPDSTVHILTMNDWLTTKIPNGKYDKEQKRYRVHKFDMRPMKLSEFQKLVQRDVAYFKTRRN